MNEKSKFDKNLDFSIILGPFNHPLFKKIIWKTTCFFKDFRKKM